MKKLFILFAWATFLSTAAHTFAQIVPAPSNEKDLEELQSIEGPEILPTCRQIIGYYCSWQWYDRGGLLAPQNVDYSRYTILNYSFFQPDTLGNLFGTDEWADSVLLRGRYDWSSSVQPAYIPNTSVIDQAHVWGVKVMVSIGGWTLSDNFPQVAKHPERRAHFAQECVRLLREYQFDGIDIDWEYPGYEEHQGSASDKENFTLLMKSIRDSIDAYGKKVKAKYLLTAAFGASQSNIDHIEYEKLVPIMDYFNIMTYDINGAWSDEANHHSPLYSPAKGYQGSVDLTFKTLTQKRRVPPEKINIGAAFYGRSVKFKNTTPALYAQNETKQGDIRTFPEDEGFPMYYYILSRKEQYAFVEKWDSVAQAPYMVSEQRGTFISYDNPQSVKLKAEYVIQHDAGGVIIWDISGDYLEKRPGSGKITNTPLVDQLVTILQPCRRKTIKKRWR